MTKQHQSLLLTTLVQLLVVPAAFGQLWQSFDTMQATRSLDSPLHVSESSVLLREPSASQNKTEIEDEDEVIDENSIHFRAGKGHFAEVRLILEQQPELVHARDSHQWTPLHEAARGGHITATQILLEYGADINAQHMYGGTPLFEAEIYHGPDSEIAKLLISQGAIRVESKSRLRGFSGEAQPYLNDIIAAGLAGKGRIDELNHLLDIHGSSLLYKQDENGWTLLHEAARRDQVPMVRFLVQRGADTSIQNMEGFTALQLAEDRLGKDAAVCQYLRQEEESGISGYRLRRRQ